MLADACSEASFTGSETGDGLLGAGKGGASAATAAANIFGPSSDGDEPLHKEISPPPATAQKTKTIARDLKRLISPAFYLRRANCAFQSCPACCAGRSPEARPLSVGAARSGGLLVGSGSPRTAADHSLSAARRSSARKI